ncbi:MAG: TRAP transporter small permease [Cohaesibacter sp.]|nr:TRAP transporter small permease [Cohaesibacter sp.]
MSDQNVAPQIDFDAIAAEDEHHFATFRISVWDYGLVALFAGLFGVVFLQFFSRYILNDSVAWTEEAARYLLIVLSFAGAIRCQATGTHIVLEFVDKYYGRALHYIHVFAGFLTFALYAIIAWSAWDLIQRTSFQKMVSLPFPKYYLHATIMSLLMVNAAVVLAQIVRRLWNVKGQ